MRVIGCVGLEPATISGPIDGPPADCIELGILKLTPYRIVLTGWPESLQMWSPDDETAATDATT